MYPLGTVLRLKTTGENVVIVGDATNDEAVIVRRPLNNSQAGVIHKKEEFLLCELDTVEESVRREYNEMKIRQAMVKGEDLRPEIVQ